MFGKIVAISTVKHLSRNYASFSNQVCKSGIAYPLLVRHKVFSKETPLTFMEMDTSCRTQDSRKTYESLPWCVMLTLNRKGCKSKFFFEKSERNLTIWRQNWLYAIDQKQRKNRKYAQIEFLGKQSNFLLPLWEPVLPLCVILRAKSK